ncbi:hypothetical protein [Chelativorans sp. AA-79]|uniref:hypothetical protein n=1 Tax=Chelativorans sp. AA-79 TaxID=3028735 RepID=UPI0023F9B3F1|nr:hypothetical protein [Chelativorans sp. AA-79]WEX07722.1 hypothetical protein PVE73_16625 [Chelativorans sp. AA-79]
MRVSAIAIVTAFLLSGCAVGGFSRSVDVTASSEQGSVRAIGGIVGGGLVMGQLGAGLNRRERLAAIDAEYRALESAPAGQPVNWSDERTRHSGAVTAAQPYRVGSQDCRPYSHSVTVDGGKRRARATACRNPDGSWTLLD